MDFLGTIPIVGNIATTAVVFILALSIIIAVHEYGHYIVGRWCGIHAEVFSLGFGPVLCSKVDKRGTKWQLAALPFGGYVKFLGDADAASGKDGEQISTLSPAERKRTMHGADLWRRSATVFAGPAFNFIMSAIVFAGVFMSMGALGDRAVIGEIHPTPADVAQFKQGDLIKSVGGIEIPDLQSFYKAASSMKPAETLEYIVERDGADVTLQAGYPMPAIVSSVVARSAAMAADMRVGDVITSVDDKPIYALSQLQEAAQAGKGAPMKLQIWRGGETLELVLVPRQRDIPTADGFESRWLVGFTSGLFFQPPLERLPPVDAAWSGVKQTWYVAANSLSALYHLATGQINRCNIQGPIGIAKTSGDVASQGLQPFIWFIAVLSTAVGLMNLFPIPVLDGGHLVFHAYEAVAGKPPNDKALNALMMGGLVILLSFMAFALTNDFSCV